MTERSPHPQSVAVAPDSEGAGEMARRLPLIGEANNWDAMSEQDREIWDAPYGPPEEWSLVIENHEAPGPHGPVPVRIYTPHDAPPGPRPCLVWCHGGGFMHGDLDMPEADHVARGVAGRAGAVVVSVDYRLCDSPAELGAAPARAFPGGPTAVHAPIPLDDVCAAVAWTRQHAEELGTDPGRLALGGASAGGNLAAAASLRLAEEGAPPAASVLLYPVAHPLPLEATAEEAEALAMTPRPLRFSAETMQAMSANYTGRDLAEAGPYEFPGLAPAEQLAVLPPTYIEADEHDDLRLSARRYAEQLREAGVDVEYAVRRGVAHGHLNRVGLAEARDSMDRIGQLVSEL